MLKLISGGLLATTILAASPASAADIIVPLGVIVVPPTQTFTPGVTFTNPGVNRGLYEFIISQVMTINVSSFTNSAINGTGVFDFTSLNLYSGFGTGGTVLKTGTIGPRTGSVATASLDQTILDGGLYTIAYEGTVTGQPAGVGSNIVFAAGTGSAGAVPEPATWAMMMLGFGMAGFGLRSRRKSKVSTRVVFA